MKAAASRRICYHEPLFVMYFRQLLQLCVQDEHLPTHGHCESPPDAAEFVRHCVEHMDKTEENCASYARDSARCPDLGSPELQNRLLSGVLVPRVPVGERLQHTIQGRVNPQSRHQPRSHDRIASNLQIAAGLRRALPWPPTWTNVQTKANRFLLRKHSHISTELTM